ncbi:hypothetical protein BOTBODRAFT_372308 [Botryobasidium botryosum FD-172 SS1]|uniref:Replication factor A protein 3 n=1 Tax=Botryobasidium botryosum (strain FD-172 SS1) TaxID=930990 RepID=A0A067MN49_BOTB1|nr:hypothetical protein BOTBODRAFT_372308 [Botryobasidium botryosum FD-172 SS1]
MEHRTPRVNSARMTSYLGQTVRLTVKVIKLQGSTALVETSDGGQVEVKLVPDANVTDTYVEFIGQVTDAQSLNMLIVTNLGSDVDLKLVDGVVEMMHAHPTIFM